MYCLKDELASEVNRADGACHAAADLREEVKKLTDENQVLRYELNLSNSAIMRVEELILGNFEVSYNHDIRTAIAGSEIAATVRYSERPVKECLTTELSSNPYKLKVLEAQIEHQRKTIQELRKELDQHATY